MTKNYSEYMDEIPSEDIYKGLLANGLFADKLPPIFTSVPFYDYSYSKDFANSKCGFGYIYFEALRNINIPRSFGIPNPFAYQQLCKFLRDRWNEIKNHFMKQTIKNKHKVSRIHIRKMFDTNALFKMTYENRKLDDCPEPLLLVGKKYIVRTDISTCFQSMYSHALAWAIEGKSEAKKKRNNKDEWFNELDKKTRALKNNETHGLLIGPHASNLLSEIILTVVDRQLCELGYEYIRNIDDYTCYVETYEKAQSFLTDLASKLREFDLQLNYAKTKIEELPVALTENWVHKLGLFDFAGNNNEVEYRKIQAYLDMAVELMYANGNNSAILNYAIKVLSDKKFTDDALRYYLQVVQHLAVIYPYLIRLMDKYVFDVFHVKREEIESFANIVFKDAKRAKNYEALIYAIYFSIKYDFDLEEIDEEFAISEDSCLLKCFTWCYYNKKHAEDEIMALEEHAKDLQENLMDEYWLFVYEALPESELKGDWNELKNAGVSFIKEEYRY